jgi:hypothetical protein
MPRVSRRPRTTRRAQARLTQGTPPAPHLTVVPPGATAPPTAAPRPCPPRRSRRQRRRQAQVAAPLPAPRPRGPERTPPEDVSTYESVYTWLRAHLPRGTYPKPVCKRLAALVSGLLVKRDCTLGALAAAIDGLDVSGATAESIERRLRRVLHDERLDPTQVLPALMGALLPTLLADLLARHAASTRHGGKRHAGRLLVRVVVDDSSHTDQVHLLLAGLAYRGLVAPLLVRTWAQNAPLPEGEYWTQLQGLLSDVQTLLPPVLRDHVLLVADRAFGVPRLLDLLSAFGWRWLLRVQGQTRVLLRDGTIRPLLSLVPCPGTTWFGQFDPRVGTPPAPGAVASPAAVAPAAVAGVFKAAGWRASQVVAAWARGTDDPWLLLTSLSPSKECLLEYARRWGIERLFLSWKSHGWDLEASHVHDPLRLGRLLTGLVLATLWRLAAGVYDATTRLADLRRRATRRLRPPLVVRQLPLPLDADLQPRQGASRPYAAKRSLFTRGTDVWEAVAGKRETPPLLWQFPDGDAPTWDTQARQVYNGSTS